VGPLRDDHHVEPGRAERARGATRYSSSTSRHAAYGSSARHRCPMICSCGRWCAR
jgi:hypothetical protein